MDQERTRLSRPPFKKLDNSPLTPFWGVCALHAGDVHLQLVEGTDLLGPSGVDGW